MILTHTITAIATATISRIPDKTPVITAGNQPGFGLTSAVAGVVVIGGTAIIYKEIGQTIVDCPFLSESADYYQYSLVVHYLVLGFNNVL